MSDVMAATETLAKRLFEAQRAAVKLVLPHYDEIMEENHGEVPKDTWEELPEEGRQIWRATVEQAGLTGSS